ncbi:hypothetical protein M501DRAFT_1000049 [Patellaria atrata CBS 101060]|uniref:HAT C-terminal dimerisation domain-containing protein n=1 Tax=Patellaria atrata CBS 101060 TaxID=1346257 RepID=A0A9P4VLX5_9PEZI|nr:hypothetical protein M501DRAFT_1000049 [Patellaria atrata CBS 101060]
MIKLAKLYWENWNKTCLVLLPASYEEKRTLSENMTDFERVLNQIEWFNKTPLSGDEFEDYINQEPYDIEDVSPIKWWLTDTQRARFPRLSILAVEILSIPAMSDEPERVFSAARRTCHGLDPIGISALDDPAA